MLKEKNIIGAIIFLFIGIVALCEGYRLSLGTLAAPGAGFVPFWTGLLLTFLSSALFIIALKAKWAQRGESVKFENRWPRVLIALMSMVIYGLSLKFIGFLICTFLLLLILLKGVEGRSWKSTVTISLICTVVSYIVFAKYLSVPLPRGMIPY